MPACTTPSATIEGRLDVLRRARASTKMSSLGHEGCIFDVCATPLCLARGTGRSRLTVVKTIGLLASALIAVGSISSDAYGEAAQDFYRNKQVRLIVGHPVGNDHDVGGRLLAKYLGKHIPGRPNV